MARPKHITGTGLRERFARNLSAARIMAGYPKKSEMADALGIEHETYRRWERAETEPSLYYLLKISELTGVTVDFLLTGKPHGPTTAGLSATG